MPARKQTRRVAAWIYAVINPIIDSLQRELSLLDSGNLTWSPYTGRCEMIRTIREYVDPAQWPNYQTFLTEYPKSVFVPGFKRHDSDLESLNNAAKALFDRMVSWNEFLGAVGEHLTTYERQRNALGPRALSPTELGNDVPKFAAEHVINNADTLPSHYTDSAFWNSYGRNLLVFRNRPEFVPLHRCRESLKEISARLEQALVNYRLSKSREYDVPAAPVPGLSLED